MVSGQILKYAQSNREMALKIQELKMSLADERRVNIELNRDLAETNQEYSKLIKVTENILERFILIGSVMKPFLADAQQILDVLPSSIGVRIKLQTPETHKLATFRNGLAVIHETETTYQNSDDSVVQEDDSLIVNSIPMTRANCSDSRIDSLTVNQEPVALNDSSIYEKVEFDSTWDIFDSLMSPKRKKSSIDTQDNQLLPSCSYRSPDMHESHETESQTSNEMIEKEVANANDNKVAVQMVKKSKKSDDRVEFENSHRCNSVRLPRRTVILKNMKEPSLRVKMRRESD